VCCRHGKSERVGSMLFTFFVGADMGAVGRLCQGWQGLERRRRRVGIGADRSHDGDGAVLLRLLGAGRVGKIKNEGRDGVKLNVTRCNFDDGLSMFSSDEWSFYEMF